MLEDDGHGMINVVKYSTDGSKEVILESVGTVDYAKGIVGMNSKFVPQISNTLVYGITITVIPENQDLFVRENKIIRINRGYSDSVSVALSTEAASRASSNS